MNHLAWGVGLIMLRNKPVWVLALLAIVLPHEAGAQESEKAPARENTRERIPLPIPDLLPRKPTSTPAVPDLGGVDSKDAVSKDSVFTGQQIERIEVIGVPGERVRLEEPETLKRHFLFDMEYLLLATRSSPQTVTIAGSTPILGPAGQINSLPSGYESGFRAGFGWISPVTEMETVLRYSYYSNQSDMQIAAPANGFFAGTEAQNGLVPKSLAGALYPTQTVPGLINQVVNAKAQANVIYQIADIEFAKRWQINDWIGLRFLAAPRFANLNQLFQVHYAGGDVNTADISRQITFNGGGLRLGGSADAVLAGNWGVRLTGSASLVTGNFQGRMTEVANGAAILSATDRFVSMVPIVDLGIGLNYNAGGWNFTLGYEFQNWINVLQGYNFVDDANPAKFQREFGNLGFDGLALRINYLW